MAVWNPSNGRSFKAAADLSLLQFTAVKLDSSGNVVAATATSDKILGILLNAPKINETAAVAMLNAGGTVKVVAGAALATRMTRLTIDSSGRAVAASQTSAGSAPVIELIGQNVGIAGALGDLVEVALDHGVF